MLSDLYIEVIDRCLISIHPSKIDFRKSPKLFFPH